MTNCEFFLIRYVPDLIKNEPVNIGLVMLDGDGGNGFAGVRFASNFDRVRCLAANADLEMIQALSEDIRQKLASVSDRQQMLRIIQDFSNTLQISETRGCQTDSPQQEIEKLAELYLESVPATKEPRAVSARAIKANEANSAPCLCSKKFRSWLAYRRPVRCLRGEHAVWSR